MNGFGWQGWSSPWQMMRQMQREMDRVFQGLTQPRGGEFPPVNVQTDADGAVVTAEVPGVEPKDLDVSVHNNTLVLRGQRKAPSTAQGDNWLRQERVFGTFTRAIDLPFAVDAEKVQATCRDGVLEVRLLRREADKPRRIEVKA